jgi:hypothetical protein
MTYKYPLGTILFSRQQANLYGIVLDHGGQTKKTHRYKYKVRWSSGLDTELMESQIDMFFEVDNGRDR